MKDTTVPVEGAGSHILAVLLLVRTLQLPTSTFLSGGEEEQTRAHARNQPKGGGPRLREREGGGEEKGIPTCGILEEGVPIVSSFPVTVSECQGRSLSQLVGYLGASRVKTEWSVRV